MGLYKGASVASAAPLQQSGPYDQESSMVSTIDMLLLKLLDHRCWVRFFPCVRLKEVFEQGQACCSTFFRVELGRIGVPLLQRCYKGFAIVGVSKKPILVLLGWQCSVGVDEVESLVFVIS